MLRFNFLAGGYFVVQMINPGLLDPSHDSAVTPAIMQSYFLCQFNIASRIKSKCLGLAYQVLTTLASTCLSVLSSLPLNSHPDAFHIQLLLTRLQGMLGCAILTFPY